MTMRIPFIDPTREDDPRELVVGLCAQQFHDSRMQIRHFRSRISRHPRDWHQGLCPDTLAAVRRRVDSAISTCDHINKALEKSFLHARRIREARFQQINQKKTFLEDFTARQIYVGSDEVPKYSSHLAWQDDNFAKPVSVARNTGRVILVAGGQGSGKTVLSTVIGEASQEAEPPMTSPEILPTAFVFFHIEEQDRLPQLLDGLKKNPKQADLDLLMNRLGVHGKGIERIRLAVPRTLLPDLMPRLLPYQDLGLQVMPLRVQLSQLGQPGLQGALGDSDARYVQRMLEEAQDQGKALSIAGMRSFLNTAKGIDSRMQGAAHTKLNWLEEIASPPDGPGMWDMIEPNMATVVYLGGPYVSQQRVLPILVGLLHGMMLPSDQHGEFQRIITVDEVNLLEKLDAAWNAFVRAGRLVRHMGSTLMLMGQDLNCVPDELFGLAELVFVFMLRNPKIWEHIRDRVGSLHGRRFSEVASLQVAEAILGMTRCTDPELRRASAKLKIRPPRCEHGGWSRAMV